MAASNDIENLSGGRFHVGLSAIIGLTLTPAQNAVLLSCVSGTTLEIGGASLTWGSGYLWGITFPISINSISTIYFAASGATATVTYLKGYSPGSSAG